MFNNKILIILMVILVLNIGFIFLLYNFFNINIIISFILIILTEGIFGMFFEEKMYFDSI